MNKIKLDLIHKTKPISFDTETHTYLLNGEKMDSVTEIIKKYVPEFDSDGSITKRKAEQNNITVKEQKRVWEENMMEAGRVGTEVHDYCEHLIWGVGVGDEELTKKFTPFSESIEPVSTEQIIHTHTYKIAGTVDLVTHNGVNFDFYDYKTNKKKITKSNFFKKFLLPPLDHLPNTNFYRYALQMSLYKYIFEEMTGYIVDNLRLVHIRKGIELIDVPYLEAEVQNILERIEKFK